MSFSVIIPTMWKTPYMLGSMIYLYRKSPLVDEVIIIKNHKGWDTSKIRSGY
jgi:hypothetical protein